MAANLTSTRLRKRDESALTFHYDALNRLSAKIVPERSDLTPAQTRNVHYEYDLRGLRTAASFAGAPNDFVRTWYDGFGRPVTVLSHMFGQPRYLSHQYDRDGNRELLTHVNDNANFRYFHDGLGRVTHVADNPSVASADDYVIRYFYKPQGPRHVAIRGAGAAGFTTAYHYDPVQRLRMMANDLPTAGDDMTVTLDYNPASHIRQYERDNNAYAWTGTVPASRAYTVNGQNQYLASGSVNFNYDANGNLIWDSANNYVYDVENRLVGASGEKSAALVYDPLGRLAQVNGPAGVTRFQYDGDRLVAEYDFAGNLLRRYVHGPGTDEPVAVYEGSALGLANRRYMLPDERGSIVALINANGTPAAINTYNEYGVPGAEPVGRFGYTGQTWIPELGLWYYKARFYSSRLGRFLQTDPIGYEGGINLYGYVHNDPTNRTDPDGTQESFDRAVRRDEQAYFNGEIDADELRERQMARGAGGVIGAGIVIAGVTTRGLGLPAATTWAGRTYMAWRAERLRRAAHVAAANFKTVAEKAGTTLEGVGKMVGWGGGRNAAAQATSRAGQINQAEVAAMREAGLTKEIATAARNAYRAAARTEKKGGEVAGERAKLMDEILRNW